MVDNSIPADEKGNVQAHGPDFFKKVAQARQYTGLLDTSHREMAIWEAVGKKENIKALADAGVKHIFLEQKISRQKEVDDFNAGKISEAELRKKAASFASGFAFGDEELRQGGAVVDILVHAKKYGIKVHFADPESNLMAGGDKVLLKEDHPLYRSDPEAAKALNEFKSITDIDKQIKFDLSISPDLKRRMDDLAIKMGAGKTEERDSINEELADFIKKKANGQKAAILYGGNHFDQLKDLNEYLGKENVTTVALLASAHQKDASIAGAPIQELPDYAYFIDDGHATKKLTFCDDALKLGASMQNQGIKMCESTLDMGTYHIGPLKEEAQKER